MSIYVEILIRAPMDALWAHTQEPTLHERWDLRFSEIDDLPRTGDDLPQRFRYATRIGWWIRTFESRRTRRFDAYMVYSDARGRIVDYLGSHEHLAVDIDLSVDQDGGLRLRSGAQRFYEGVIGFSFPMVFSGIADVREWYGDKVGCFRIIVDIRSRLWGPLFGYRGSFCVDWRTVPAGFLPDHIRPRRQEHRD